MPLQIYNTLSRSKEEFIPIVPQQVGMYVCGMTVYSDAHIGHAKSYVTFDVVRRYLMFLGYHVTYVQNVTDVGHMTDNDEDAGEDKLLKESARTKIHPMQIAETFTRRTNEDLAALNILPPDIMPRASGHIIEQIAIIKDLIAKGFAYEVGGSVYFDVTKDPEYGKLSGREIKTEVHEKKDSKSLFSDVKKIFVGLTDRVNIKSEGKWGEFMLSTLIEKLHLTEHSQILFEPHNSGKLLPDVIINLPEGKKIVIDSKLPIDFLDIDMNFIGADSLIDKSVYTQKFKKIAEKIKKHIELFSEVNLRTNASVDLALLYFSNDVIFSNIFNSDPTIIKSAIKNRVFPVGPSLLVDVLKKIGERWRKQSISQHSTKKRNPEDFALWKNAEKGHILHWPSPWGEGFPGWHIECSAMSMKYLGQTIDIHGGGLENQFPHHECEIAQSECSTGKQFVRYWMHHNMVTVDNVKMGKSLGNSSFLRDLYKDFEPMTLRFYLLGSHYRSTTEFKKDAIDAAGIGYAKLLSAFARISEAAGDAELRPLNSEERAHPLVAQFVTEMNDDFNTPKGIAILYDLAKESNTLLAEAKPDAKKIAALYQIWNALAGNILGILPAQHSALSTQHSDSLLPAVIKTIIGWRNEARATKDFKMSDAIRDDLLKAGITLEDSKDGTKWVISR